MSNAIWYAHVVGYFERDLALPIQTVATLAAQFEAVAGADPVEYWGTVSAIWPDRGPLATNPEPKGKAAAVAEAVEHIRTIGPGFAVCDLMMSRSDSADQKWTDYVWKVNYSHEQDFPTYQADATIIASIRLNIFKGQTGGRTACKELIDKIVRVILEAGDAYYLAVDLAEMSETGANGVYLPSGYQRIGPHSYRRELTRRLWESEGRYRRNFVPGIYWTNYLSAALLERLGGKESFRERYLTHAKGQVRDWRTLVADAPRDGLLVRTFDDPFEDMLAHLGLENVVWLHRELRAIGALL